MVQKQGYMTVDLELCVCALVYIDAVRMQMAMLCMVQSPRDDTQIKICILVRFYLILDLDKNGLSGLVWPLFGISSGQFSIPPIPYYLRNYVHLDKMDILDRSHDLDN